MYKSIFEIGLHFFIYNHLLMREKRERKLNKKFAENVLDLKKKKIYKKKSKKVDLEPSDSE